MKIQRPPTINVSSSKSDMLDNVAYQQKWYSKAYRWTTLANFKTQQLECAGDGIASVIQQIRKFIARLLSANS